MEPGLTMAWRNELGFSCAPGASSLFGGKACRTATSMTSGTLTQTKMEPETMEPEKEPFKENASL